MATLPTVKHAYMKLEEDGHVSLLWWVDGGDGVATRAVIHLHAGALAFKIGFDEWRRSAGTLVGLDEVHRHLVLGSIRNSRDRVVPTRMLRQSVSEGQFAGWDD